jgi:Co/Zn/Cd efflux system component
VLVNVAVITRGLVTAWTGSGWPDLALGRATILLALHAAHEVWKVNEKNATPPHPTSLSAGYLSS